MKAITWDAATRLFKEVVTGRIFTASSEPVDIADGDLWVDSASTPVLKAKVAGVIYEVVGAGGGGGGYLEEVSSSVSTSIHGGTMNEAGPFTEDVTVTNHYPVAATSTPTVVLY